MMLVANRQNSRRFPLSLIGLFLGLGFSLYAYRFPVGIGNISVLRMVIILLGVRLFFSLSWSARPLPISYWVLLLITLLLTSINLYHYPSLDEYHIPKTEMVAHMVNMALLLEIVAWVKSECDLISILNGYVLSSLAAVGIAYYAFVCGNIPFEDVLRGFDADLAGGIYYVLQDGDFFRFSGPFVDPNFFGIYLLTIVIFSSWLYLFRGKDKIHLFIAIIALFTLPLTLSRTAVVGLIVFFVTCLGWAREKDRFLLVAMAVLLGVIGLGVLLIADSANIDRWLDASSATERMHFISMGLDAFMRSPLFGDGPASIVDDATGIATAHLMYLSVLAKFGLFGGFIYFTWVFYPLINVAIRGSEYLREYRLLVTAMYFPLFFMYFLYDFLTFLEFEYFVFSVGYSVVFSVYARKQASRREVAPHV